MRKVQLTIRQEEVAPATTSDLVVMNNGKTLKEELSTNPLDQFSREVTVVNSMEKMVDGTCDGTYENLVFHGRSLVNVCPNGVIDYIATSDWDGYNGIGQASNTQGYSWKTLQDLKPNTKYFVSCHVETFNVGENQYYLLNNRNDSTVFGESLYIRTTGLHKWVLTTKSEFTEDVHIALRCQNAYARGAIKIRDIMIIEYVEGMENWDIPYFEGMCDVKMPIVRNVGKNLLYALDGRAEYGGITLTSSNGKIIVNGTATSNAWVNLQPIFQAGTSPNIGETFLRFNNTTLTLSTNIIEGSLNGNQMSVTLWEKDGAGDRNLTTQVGKSVTRTITEPIEFKRFWAMFPEGTSYNNVVFTIQLEESSSTTTYEDYKTNILRTSEEIILREVNGIQDTYNALTGEYTQRIEEVVFDGSVDETWSFSEMKGENYRFGIYLSRFGNGMMDRTPLICNRLKVGSVGQETTQEQIVVYNHTTSFEVRITLSPSTISSNNIDEFRRYLQENPVIIQYELAQPVTTIVEPSTIPFAYQNGHVIVESGFDGPSLLPELSYSVPVSKSGVISTASKTILNHEQRLHKLEGLLVRESILMDYRLTLSFLNNM